MISGDEYYRKLKEIGGRLRLFRMVVGETQEELGKAVGVTAQAWSSYERGEREFSAINMLLLCDKFGITTEWILRGRLDMVEPHLRDKLAGAAIPKKQKRGRPVKKRP